MSLIQSLRGSFSFSESASTLPTLQAYESGSFSTSKEKPPSLKQRTSSVDTRSDFRRDTWLSLRDLVKAQELFCSVNYFPIWRRHLAWAMDDGKELKSYMTGRYSSSMIFLSLLLGAELNVMFNSAPITTEVRHSLSAEDFSLSFWIGLAILGSTMLTLLALITTFTAWSMVGAISDTNAHCILRSSIGQYVLELPQQFMVGSIYCFLIWLTLFFFKLMNSGILSCGLFIVMYALLFHIIMTFSAFGRLILHTTAMSKQRIFESNFERGMTPPVLQEELHKRAKAELMNATSIKRQYEKLVVPVNANLSPEGLQEHLKRSRLPDTAAVQPSMARSVSTSRGNRKRGDSLVRFATDISNNRPSSPTSHNRLTPTAEMNSSLASSRASSSETFNKDLTIEVDAVPPPPPSDIGTPGGFSSVGSLNAWLTSSNDLTETPTSPKRKKIQKDFSNENSDTTPWSETPIKKTSANRQSEISIGEESTIDSQGSQIRQEIESQFQSLNGSGRITDDYIIPLKHVMLDSDYEPNNESLDLDHLLGPDLPIISTSQKNNGDLPQLKQPSQLEKISIASKKTKKFSLLRTSPTLETSHASTSSIQQDTPQTPNMPHELLSRESSQNLREEKYYQPRSDSAFLPAPAKFTQLDRNERGESDDSGQRTGQEPNTSATHIDKPIQKNSSSKEPVLSSVEKSSETQRLLMDYDHQKGYSSTSFSDNV